MGALAQARREEPLQIVCRLPDLTAVRTAAIVRLGEPDVGKANIPAAWVPCQVDRRAS